VSEFATHNATSPVSVTLSAAVAALRETGAILTESGARTHELDPGMAAFGGAGPGRLGELGRALHHQWQSALDARAREGAAHGARVDDAADGLARAASGYAESDESSAKQHPEVS
jgi:hypothetical protein